MFVYRTKSKRSRGLRRNPAAKCFAVFAAICLSCGLSMGGEEIALDWSFIGEGQDISGTPYGLQGVPLLLQSKTALVTSSSSTPTNPFPNSELSLFIDQDPNSTVSRVRLRPFQNETPPSGSYEINFRLVEGRFRLDTGVSSVPWDPLNDWSYIQTEGLFGIRFTADEPIQCKSATGLRTESIGAISADENYIFRGEWETDGDNVVFQFYLNSEPLITPDQERYFVTIPKARFEYQALALSINIGSSEEPPVRVFLGRITATSGKP